MSKKNRNQAKNAKDIFGNSPNQVKRKTKVNTKKVTPKAAPAAPVSNIPNKTPSGITSQDIYNLWRDFHDFMIRGTTVKFDKYGNLIDDTTMANKVPHIEFHVIARKEESRVMVHDSILVYYEVIPLEQNFDLRTFCCPVCGHTILSYELCHDLSSQGKEALQQWLTDNPVCEGCNNVVAYGTKAGVQKYAASMVQEIEKKIQDKQKEAKTATFEWNNLWFESENQEICPVCNSETKDVNLIPGFYGQRTFQAKQDRACHNCGALKVGSAQIIYKELKDFNRKAIVYLGYGGDGSLEDFNIMFSYYNNFTFGKYLENQKLEDYMNKTTITWDAQAKVYKVQFGFLRDRKMFDAMLELLKKSIPSSDRVFDKAKKLWLVSESYLDVMKMVAEAYYSTVEVVEKEKVEKIYEEWQANSYTEKPIIISDELSIFTKLIHEAGFNLTNTELNPKDIKPESDVEPARKKIKKTYQRAIMFFHPDRYSQATEEKQKEMAEKASQLNASWQNLQEHFGFEKPKMELEK